MKRFFRITPTNLLVWVIIITILSAVGTFSMVNYAYGTTVSSEKEPIVNEGLKMYPMTLENKTEHIVYFVWYPFPDDDLTRYWVLLATRAGKGVHTLYFAEGYFAAMLIHNDSRIILDMQFFYMTPTADIKLTF